MPLSLDTTVPSIAASGRSLGGSLGARVGLVGTERRVAGTMGMAFRRTVGAKGVRGGMGGKLGTELEDFMALVRSQRHGAGGQAEQRRSTVHWTP